MSDTTTLLLILIFFFFSFLFHDQKIIMYDWLPLLVNAEVKPYTGKNTRNMCTSFRRIMLCYGKNAD